MRLEAHRESLKKKKVDEEAKLRPAEEEKKRDEGDIFRNTQMKFNESPDQKKMRLKRCLNALKQADIGKPSAFVGMKVGQAIDIEWNREHENIVQDADDEDSAAVMVEKKGRRVIDDDDF